MGELLSLLLIAGCIVAVPLIMAVVGVTVGVSTIIVYLALMTVVVPVRGTYRLLRHLALRRETIAE